MNFQDIQLRYTPLQPTITSSTRDVVYREVAPDNSLRNIISCYWELKTIRPLDNEFIYSVVTDGCIDIFFELRRPHENFVMGVCKKYTEFNIGKDFNYAGVRFLPTMFPQLFKINASELSNSFAALGDVIPATANFITNYFNEHHVINDVRKIFDDYFLQLLKNVHFDYDGRLYEALDIILKNAGALKIETNINTGISQRQLLRLFEYYIGETPKTFSRIVRFQHILQARPSIQSLKQNKLFYDVGYYDQAHFIKEFRNFYGVTPTKAFSTR